MHSSIMQIFTRPVPHLDEYEYRNVAKTVVFPPCGTQMNQYYTDTDPAIYIHIVNADI